MQHLDSLAVHIRQLFHFQGALQASGKIESPENGKIHFGTKIQQEHLPSHYQQTSLFIQLLCYLQNL